MYDIVVAGFITSDIFPTFYPTKNGFRDVFVPGRLVNIGPINITTGGAVANTGLALLKLGINTSLMGKIGDDDIGGIIKNVINQKFGFHDDSIVAKGCESAYTIAVEVPGVDRVLCTHSGVADTFTPEDLDYEKIKGAKIFHYGYPTLNKLMHEDGGERMAAMFQKTRELGCVNSLDVTLPDPNSPSGKVDWKSILAKTLPYVDIFLPSVEELIYMLDKERYDVLKAKDDDIIAQLTMDDLPKYGQMLLDLGVKIAGIKCGTKGFYVKTAGADQIETLKALSLNDSDFGGKEVFSKIFKAKQVVSTTGAGDTSIAGFLAGLVRGYSLKKTIETATGSGAMCVTQYGAVEGIPTLEQLDELIGTELKKDKEPLSLNEWEYNEADDLYYRKK